MTPPIGALISCRSGWRDFRLNGEEVEVGKGSKVRYYNPTVKADIKVNEARVRTAKVK